MCESLKAHASNHGETRFTFNQGNASHRGMALYEDTMIG